MRKIIFQILILLISFNASAQRDFNMQERIKAQKVAFITERLNLTPKEAQQFWPIYNAFENKIQSFRKNDLKKVREAMRRGNLSDKEAQQVLAQFMDVEEKIHQAKKELVKDLQSAISPQKIIKLKSAEDAFNKKLMNILQNRQAKMQEMRQRRMNKNKP